MQPITRTYSGGASQQRTVQGVPKRILPASSTTRTFAKLEVDAQTGTILDPNTEIGDSNELDADDYFNRVKSNDDKPLTSLSNQGIERRESINSSNINHGERRDSTSSAQVSFEASGVRPKKPCNCTKSQCLKL